MATVVQNKGTKGLLDNVTPEKTYLDLILELRKKDNVASLAEQLSMTESDLAELLKKKGFDRHGYPIYDKSGVMLDDYTPITDEIKALLKNGLKKGLDTEALVEYYKISRTEGSGVILQLKRELKEDSAKLYPLKEIEGTRGKYNTMITVAKR